MLETDEEKLPSVDENVPALNGVVPTYHPPVAAWTSISLNARAHLSTHRKTIAYGR